MSISNIDHYFSVRGTATRKEFWAVTAVVFVALFAILFVTGMEPFGPTEGIVQTIEGFIIIIGGALAWWVQLATAARRCRDIGLNPWMSVLITFPYVGMLVWFIFGCMSSDTK